MINLIEIKDRQIFFVTNEGQCNELLKIIESPDYINYVIITYNDLLIETKYDMETMKYYYITSKIGKVFDYIIQSARKRNISIINFCNDTEEVGARYKYRMGRKIKIDDEKKIMIYQNYKDGIEHFLNGTL